MTKDRGGGSQSQGERRAPRFLEFFAVPARPSCHKQVPFWPGPCSRELALGHTVAPDTALPVSSEPRTYTSPSCCVPASLSLLCSLFSAQRSLVWPLVWPSSWWPSSPPTSQSVALATQALHWKRPHCSNVQAPPGCAHLGGVSGQSRITATRARVSAAGIRGLGDELPPPPPQPSLSPPTPLHAERALCRSQASGRVCA